MTNTLCKIFLFFIVMIFVMATPYAASASSGVSSRHNKPVFLNMKPEQGTTPEQLKCMRRVLMTVGDQAYEVSRLRSLTYTTPDGRYHTDQDTDHPAIDCNIVDVGPVKSVSTGYKNWKDIDIEISDVNPQNPGLFITTYAKSKSVIDDMTKSLLYKKLPDGTRKFIWEKVVIYQLPKEILKTYNGEPVVVYCRTNQDDIKNNICNAKYFHPDGVGFGYSYLENKTTESDHFGLDILARKRFKEMKRAEPAAAPMPPSAAPPAAPATAPPAQ